MNARVSATIDALLDSWGKNLGYARRLVADVPADGMTRQPAPGMNHPAWVLAHLSAYHGVIASMVRRQPFDDPKDHPFGMKSKPMADPAVYGPGDQLIEVFARGHDQVQGALRGAGSDVLEAPVPLERWRSVMPTVASALVYLMILHESTHLGQLSAWRRVQGMPSV